MANSGTKSCITAIAGPGRRAAVRHCAPLPVLSSVIRHPVCWLHRGATLGVNRLAGLYERFVAAQGCQGHFLRLVPLVRVLAAGFSNLLLG